jgi:hypothetical protein
MPLDLLTVILMGNLEGIRGKDPFCGSGSHPAINNAAILGGALREWACSPFLLLLNKI